MLDWIQSSGIAHLVQDSLWGYVIVLSSHAIGMAFLVGIALMVNLVLLGAIPGVPLAPLRTYLRIALAGFVLNFVSGSMLFAADAYYFFESRPFRVKLSLLVLSGVLLAIVYRRLAPGPDAALQATRQRVGKLVPALAVIAWVGVIVSGRLIAYL